MIKDEKIKQWAALNLSLILNERKDKIFEYINQEDLKIFRDKFFLINTSFSEKCSRFFIQNLLNRISWEKRWKITSFLKGLRKKCGCRPLKPSNCPGTKLILDISKRINIPLRKWHDKKAVICLTHDVDTSEGYQFIPQLIEMEKDLKSSFNFLIKDNYQIKKETISFLKNNGFEIGLHGVTHDIFLAYRNEKRIEEMISIANNDISECGFRSPALSISNSLFQVLGKNRMIYDSSVSLYYRNLASCFPYLLPEANIWELPLCLQDDILFRDLKLNSQEAFSLVKEFVNDVKEIGGVCVLNFHPILIKRNLDFYKKTIAFLSNQSDVWITTAGQLIDLMNQRL